MFTISIPSQSSSLPALFHTCCRVPGVARNYEYEEKLISPTFYQQRREKLVAKRTNALYSIPGIVLRGFNTPAR